jgi:hypothetical protein
MPVGFSDLRLLLRRPLELLFLIGCAVSMWASGRLSVRLIADGMVSFAFVPAFQILSFAAIYRRLRDGVAFAPAADLFFATDWRWRSWLVAIAALRLALTPMQAGAPPELLFRAVQASVVGVIAWSAYADYRFFLDRMSRPRESVRALVLQRAVSWMCSLVYFYGIAVWPVIVDRFGP